MLQDPRPCYLPLLGHVSHQKEGNAPALCPLHQEAGALSHLGYRAGSRLNVPGGQGLDRVHHHGGAPPKVIQGAQQRFDLRLPNEVNPLACQTQPFSSHLDLVGRLLP
jgi:hypothetical protein